MKKFEIFAATLNVTPTDFLGNRKKILEVLETAAKGRKPKCSQLILFPELPITGNCEDFFQMPSVAKRALCELRFLLPQTLGQAAVLTIPFVFESNLYLAAVLCSEGRIERIFCASEIPPRLTRWFTPWQGDVKTWTDGGESIPIGSQPYENKDGIKIAVEFGILPKDVNRSDVHLVLIPAADPFEMGKDQRRREAIEKGANSDSVTVWANLAGNESGMTLYDGGSLIACGGKVYAREGRFTFRNASYVLAEFGWDSSASRFCPLSEPILSAIFEDADQSWEAPPAIEMEEFPRAAAVGLYDYLRKSHSGGFVLSLSGGADSAAIAVILRLMAALGTRSLGTKHFLSPIRYIPAVASLWERAASGQPVSDAEITAALLTTVYQRTRNNSEITRRAAMEVAKAAGSVHYEFEIDSLVEGYKSMVAGALGRTLDWGRDDLALQNIQARVRGPAAWLLANLRGALLLSTGNRSEVACGYATMDGDTCGSISPIAGVSKEFLRRWLRWMEETGILLDSSDSVAPVRLAFPALSWINRQQPTAELRPLETKQTDEADLMPYTVLNIIERGIVEKRLDGEDLAAWVKTELQATPLAGETPEQIAAWIQKFKRLFARSQWKRYRYAMGFHLDRYDLSPFSGFRFPALSGGIDAIEADEDVNG